MGRLRGNLDLVVRDRIEGWARDDEDPEPSVRLRIWDNGTPIGECVADTFREDLLAAAIGDGRHAFSFQVPGGLSPDIRHLIEVERLDDGAKLDGSPIIFEASAANANFLRSAKPANWRGNLEVVNRRRIEGWAFDDAAPHAPISLIILSNGQVIARVLANRYRSDLESAGMADGRHAFSVIIPGGLSPLTKHVVQLLGESDGCEMPGSPVVIEAAAAFDASLEHVVSAAVGAIADPADRERALVFFAAQSERLLKEGADAEAGRETRLIQRQLERRWGRGGAPPGGTAPVPARLRVLVVDDLVPIPHNDAGSEAILSHMRALQNLGYEVTFVASDALSPTDSASNALEALGIRCCRLPFYASVEEILRRQSDCFDVVYLHRCANAAKYLALARHYAGRARILYSVADLHFLRLMRQAAVEHRPELTSYARSVRQAELVAASLASAVITHSSAEAEILRQAISGINVHVVPWAVRERPTSTSWEDRRDIAFIGSFGHSPNPDAARFLVQQIMPTVWRTDPSIKCLLVGSGLTDAVKRLAAPKIEVLGHVPRLSTVLERVRLTAAPLRFGAGVKGKVLDSLAAGVPCAMSSIAAEGIALPESLSRIVGDDVDAFVGRLFAVYGDPVAWRAASQASLDLIRDQYGERIVMDALKGAIEGQGMATAQYSSARYPLGTGDRSAPDQSGRGHG